MAEAAIAVPATTGGTLRHDLRGIAVVWRREMIRFFRNRMRIVTSLAQPVLFLFVLGTGLARLIPGGAGFDFRTFMFPGVLAMTVLFTAIFSAVSIVWDREFGFLREMLVAPIGRTALVVGKVLGGATVATLQAAIMLAMAGLVHVPYSPTLLLTLLAMMALTAVTVTAVGTLVASRMTQIESFQVVIQFLVLPMFFLSGAVFPVSQLPAWLEVLTRLDPLSYAVDPMRAAIFAHIGVAPQVAAVLNPGMTWAGWHVPTWLELVVVAAIGLASLVGAALQFSRTE
ncbi:MAG TPA: ABC transporter permease [Actinomycetota bacterium]